jgi:hypothetical protein
MKSNHHAVDQTASTLKKTWLVEYAVTEVSFGDERTLTQFGLIQGTDIRDAELEALREHVPEGFANSPANDPEDNEEGEWLNYCGLRAFELSDNCPAVDAGSIYWVKSLREVNPQDAPILAKYIDRGLTYKQMAAEENEQIRLRSAGVEATRKSSPK